MRGLLVLVLFAAAAVAEEKDVRTSFDVRYVAAGAVYLNGGREDGLAEGFHLTVTRLKSGAAQSTAIAVAEIKIVAVAAKSSVCEVSNKKVDVELGDVATLASADEEQLRIVMSAKNSRHYAQVISFTDGDPLEEEQRAYVPHPPSPEVNRVRGRFGVEYGAILDHQSKVTSVQEGFSARFDMSRIGGSFWNVTGYWRGRLNTQGGTQIQTVTDLVNRTYHMGVFYNNPESKNVMGFGRLYVPWASSLSTIDGGYYGRRLNKMVTVGAFAGSTPDPTAWNYNPNREIGGALVNIEAGSFDHVRFASTSGLALTRLKWQAEREFVFFENSLFFKRTFSVYHNAEIDKLTAGRLGNTQNGPALSKSFLTMRYQPFSMISIDLNHNYFRTIPTFDTILLGTGLLDKLLFQGLSAGVRIDLPRRVSLYSNIGRNKRADDTRASWNYLYGVTVARLWHTGLRADFRTSRFTSTFGQGSYQTITFSRDVGDRLRIEFQGGHQDFKSAFSSQGLAYFTTSNLDWFLGRHYILSGGLSLYRGKVLDYEQILFSLGYRF